MNMLIISAVMLAGKPIYFYPFEYPTDNGFKCHYYTANDSVTWSCK